jgi:hypothetical protein
MFMFITNPYGPDGIIHVQNFLKWPLRNRGLRPVDSILRQVTRSWTFEPIQLKIMSFALTVAPLMFRFRVRFWGGHSCFGAVFLNQPSHYGAPLPTFSYDVTSSWVEEILTVAVYFDVTPCILEATYSPAVRTWLSLEISSPSGVFWIVCSYRFPFLRCHCAVMCSEWLWHMSSRCSLAATSGRLLHSALKWRNIPLCDSDLQHYTVNIVHCVGGLCDFRKVAVRLGRTFRGSNLAWKFFFSQKTPRSSLRPTQPTVQW